MAFLVQFLRLVSVVFCCLHILEVALDALQCFSGRLVHRELS